MLSKKEGEGGLPEGGRVLSKKGGGGLVEGGGGVVLLAVGAGGRSPR